MGVSAIMGKLVIKKGEKLHSIADEVTSVDVLLKGKISLMSESGFKIPAGNGTVFGIALLPGDKYGFDYLAEEESTVYSYDYKNKVDLIKVIKANPNIAPVMTSASVRYARYFSQMLKALRSKAEEKYEEIKEDYDKYADECAVIGQEAEKFDSVENLPELQLADMTQEWRDSMLTALYSHDAEVRKGFYAVDIEFSVGIILTAGEYISAVSKKISKVEAYMENIDDSTADFKKAKNALRAKINEEKIQNASDSDTEEVPEIKGALDMILAYSGVDSGIAEEFRELVGQFRDAPDRLDASDDMRKLRRNITKLYYQIYEAAFFKSIENGKVSPVIRMFFIFGFVDEILAGEENTKTLYNLAIKWRPDKNKKVLTAYEWLCTIYAMTNAPSKNEFDNDWPAQLKEERREGNITEAEESELLNDPKARVHFELNNMLSVANRITYGSVSSFVAVFYKEEAVRPIINCMLNAEKINAAIDELTAIDYGCFYRETVTSYQDLGINQFPYQVEVRPYIILMPNEGSRASLWQEIEGRKRTTSARMIISILHTEDIMDSVVKMCGEFRWEMCRRIQGVHWNDITDPSLTSEYSDYLQFYRKNRDISPETREKIKLALQKARGNNRGVFVADYEAYIKNESKGQSKLNKVARDIIFRYCTFSKQYRTNLASNPQYQNLIEKWGIKREQKRHSIDLIARKIQTVQSDLPKEVESEIAYLQL